ncbi:eukaryotic initiation factor 4E [Balamuthia mandrillaris]
MASTTTTSSQGETKPAHTTKDDGVKEEELAQNNNNATTAPGASKESSDDTPNSSSSPQASSSSSSDSLLPLPTPGDQYQLVPGGSTSSSSTAFADPTNFDIKHPLQNRWTMWYDNPKTKAISKDTWGNFLKEIIEFDTVEDFWGLYNNVVPASALSVGSNYHLFKAGIEPKWEDPANEKGGKWVLSVPASQRRDKLDKLWLYSLLACIGEAFDDDGNEICGVVVSLRRAQDRIALWTRTATKETAVKNIGRTFKQALELPSNSLLGYQCHADSMRRNSSFSNKPRYEV